jgi:choline-glycine betaine transporter
MVPFELITMACGSVVGFFFRYMAERAKERQHQFEMLMQKEEMMEKTRAAASQREVGDAGKFVRRAIIVSVLFGVILAPFFLALLGKSTIVQIDEQKAEFLFGLFGGGTETKLVELPSYLLMPEVRQSLMAIIGYYFGSTTAAAKN